MTQTCSGCRFWARRDHDRGECRRHAPGGPGVRYSGVGSWALVPADAFCGEYQPLPLAQGDQAEVERLREALAAQEGYSAELRRLADRQAAESEGLREVIRRAQAACGLPDPAEGCRVVLGLCRAALPGG
jgi:hypothetical protein